MSEGAGEATTAPGDADKENLVDAGGVDSGGVGEATAAPDDATGEPVKIEMTMTSPACPAGPQLIAGAKKEVGSLEGVGNVEVKIVLDPPWTPDRMTEDAKDQLGIF
ncbi:MAG: metal-sulfur cluster assembly factor [Planctomycetota bacterium]|nr:MAG: metal-sulfur cluster assembly factor [Planctomycetota bacterium]